MKTMNDFKGSKGTWICQSFVKLGDPFFIDCIGKGREIATIHASAGKDEQVGEEDTSYDEAQANARLFANSKKVLEAACELMRFKDSISYMASKEMVTPDNILKSLTELEQAINESL